MADADDRSAAHASEQRPSVLVAALLVIGVIPFMAGLLALYTLLGVGMPYIGLFFLLYWAGILRQEPSQFLPSVTGALGGLGLGWLLLTLPAGGDLRGQLAAAAVLAAVLFCFMRGHLKILCNNAMMLFLIVGTIPNLQVERSLIEMMASLVISASYMGAVTIAIRLIGAVWISKKLND
jgi:hypothetical protein